MNQVEAASLIFRAPPDPLVTPEEEFNASYFWDGLESTGFYVDMKTCHIAWLIDKRQTKRITKRTMIAWLKRHFDGETGLDGYFSGEIMKKDINSGIVIGVKEK